MSNLNPATGRALSRRRFGQLLLGGVAGAVALTSFAGRAIGRPGAPAAWSDDLPRSRPESQGTDPQAILDFLDEVSAAGLELDSFMLARHGQVIAEGWWWPYRADRRHMMHSLTKSVTACGVGLAMAEGHFGLDDKVTSFFKEDLPPSVDPKLAAMRVEDLLTMRTGHAEETSGSVWRQIKTSWVAEFFKIPIVYAPGTKFVYTSASSFMLSAIVTKTTGQTLRDYLEPRLFKPLGIRGLSWDVGPGGISPGGNGLSWRTADSLKLGMLHARNGLWNGKRVLPEEWVRSATTLKVPEGPYGYQWWMGPGSAYYALGLFVQLSIVFPEHDAVLATTAAIDGSDKLLPFVWQHFPAAFGAATATPEVSPAEAKLADRCAHLRLLPTLTAAHSPLAARISGRTFDMEPNEEAVTQVHFDFTADRCVFRLRDDRGEHRVLVGLRDWIEGDTSMTGNKLHHQYQLDRMRVVAGGRWLDERTFEMTWQFVESAFRDTVVCRFDGDQVSFDRSVNVNSAATRLPTIRGSGQIR
jgi:CubicO group peptidase (beta-lactamase class C family)